MSKFESSDPPLGTGNISDSEKFDSPIAKNEEDLNSTSVKIGPVIASNGSGNSLCESYSPGERRNSILPASSIQSSAADLGLEPDLLHVFVFSDAGKPIYTRYGDESKLAHLMGAMQALVSVVVQQGDQLQTLVTSDKLIVFRIFGHLILVAVGSSRESVSHLSVILKYVHNQIVSALTNQRLERWFAQKQNLDLRNLMVGDSRLLSGAIDLVEMQMGPTLNAVLCIPLPSPTRDTVVQAIVHGTKSQDLLFAILLTNYRVVCIVSMKKHFLHPLDIHLITNLVRCSQSFRNASTNWLPICLPKFNANGYLYANLSYLDNHSCLVLLTVDSSQFYSLQTSREQILARLQSAMQGECLQRLAAATWPDVASLGFGGGLRHFVCKLVPANQYTTSRWTAPYNINVVPAGGRAEEPATSALIARVRHRQEAVLRSYRVMHKGLHCPLHPVSCVFHASDTEAQLASMSSDYEVYMTLEPLVSKQEAFEILRRLTKWISVNKQRLFILSSPTF